MNLSALDKKITEHCRKGCFGRKPQEEAMYYGYKCEGIAQRIERQKQHVSWRYPKNK